MAARQDTGAGLRVGVYMAVAVVGWDSRGGAGIVVEVVTVRSGDFVEWGLGFGGWDFVVVGEGLVGVRGRQCLSGRVGGGCCVVMAFYLDQHRCSSAVAAVDEKTIFSFAVQGAWVVHLVCKSRLYVRQDSSHDQIAMAFRSRTKSRIWFAFHPCGPFVPV